MTLPKLWDIQWPMSPNQVEAINANFDFLFRKVAQAPAAVVSAAVSGGAAGLASLTGIANQIVVSGTLTDPILGTPQDIGTASAVQFGSAGLAVAPEAGSVLKVNGHAYIVQYDAGSSGAAKTIDWVNGNEQILLLTADCTLTFSNPKSGGRYVLRLKQGAAAPFLVTWPASVVWSGDVEPTLSTEADGLDLIAFYWDGTNYIGAGGNSAAATQGMPEIPLAVVHGGTGLTSIAEGEILYGNSIGGIAKLAAGTDGEILTMGADTPAWASPSPVAGLGTCAVYLSSDTVINVGVELSVEFDAELWDDDGYHDNLSNPERVTVPTGKAGTYVVAAGIGFGRSGVGGGEVYTRLYLNGTLCAEVGNHGLNNLLAVAASQSNLSTILQLAEGDYLELRGMMDQSEITVAVEAGSYRTFLRLAQVK